MNFLYTIENKRTLHNKRNIKRNVICQISCRTNELNKIIECKNSKSAYKRESLFNVKIMIKSIFQQRM